MPPRAQYQLHRYAARPSSLAPADKQSRSALAKRAAAARDRLGRRTPVCVTQGFLTELRRLAAKWAHQANVLEKSPGAQLITSAAARLATIKTKRLAAKNLRDLLDEI